MGYRIGPTFKGVYQLVPPPGANVTGFGLKRLKRGLKKVGKGVKKAGKVTIKMHTMPLKAVAKVSKYGLKAMTKLAARPIIKIVNKLAGRRAGYLAFKKTGSTTTTLADRKAGGQYALNKLKKAGPFGTLAIKILKFTGGVTSGDQLSGVITRDVSGWRRDANMCGVAPAVVAAAAASIITSVTKIMKALNKPGEAPANPEAAAKQAQPTEETQPVIESAEDSAETPAEETPAEEASTEETPEGDATEGMTLDEQIAYVQENEPNNHALLKKLAAKWRRLHPND